MALFIPLAVLIISIRKVRPDSDVFFPCYPEQNGVNISALRLLVCVRRSGPGHRFMRSVSFHQLISNRP